MGRVNVIGATFAGVAAAARLARAGHAVTLIEPDAGWPAALRAALRDPLDFPAPWRDLFAKTGRPAVGALGLHGLVLVPDPGTPTDRGARWRHDIAALGAGAAVAWRDLVDRATDTWQVLRPLGLEAELTPDAVARAARAPHGLDPRRSLAHVAGDLGHPVLAARVAGLAADLGLDPADAPAWLVSRLAVRRTFGRWRLLDAAGTPTPASALVDVLADRLRTRGVRIAPDAPDADAVVDTRDPGLTWHRPRRFRRRDTFVDQLLARPPVRAPGDARRFAASASSAGGSEPWAQLLTGALAAYAAHEALTGEDIRPTNRAANREH